MNASVDCDLRKERERENERTRETRERTREEKKRKNKIKKIEERTSVGCDEHRSNQAIPSSTKDIVLKLGDIDTVSIGWKVVKRRVSKRAVNTNF